MAAALSQGACDQAAPAAPPFFDLSGAWVVDTVSLSHPLICSSYGEPAQITQSGGAFTVRYQTACDRLGRGCHDVTLDGVLAGARVSGSFTEAFSCTIPGRFSGTASETELRITLETTPTPLCTCADSRTYALTVRRAIR
jgi:hypothetical protein